MSRGTWARLRARGALLMDRCVPLSEIDRGSMPCRFPHENARAACRRWRSNPSGKCSQERLARGTVTSTMRRAAYPSGCERCGAGAGCSAIKYQSLERPISRRDSFPSGHVCNNFHSFVALLCESSQTRGWNTLSWCKRLQSHAC